MRATHLTLLLRKGLNPLEAPHRRIKSERLGELLPGIKGQEPRQEDVVTPHHEDVLFPLNTLIDPAHDMPFGKEPLPRNPHMRDTTVPDELVYLFLIKAKEISQFFCSKEFLHNI
jgi:hypothetical protein